jgi:oligosaccharide repeat unit polymerase
VIYDAILCIENRFWKKPLFFMVAQVLLQTMYTAGRTIIFFASFSLLFVYAFYSQVKHDDYSMKVVKKRLKVFLIIFALIVVGITLLRNNSKEGILSNVIETVLSYFCGGTRVFNQILQQPSFYGLDAYTFGICTFAGLLSILSTIQTYSFGKLGLGILPASFSSYTIAQGYVAKRITYGVNSAMNAFPTMFYYFVRDAGVIGLIIGPILFARVISHVEKKLLKTKDLINSFKYFYLMYALLMSVCWWEPMRQEFWMTFLWGVLICNYILKPRLTIVFKRK